MLANKNFTAKAPVSKVMQEKTKLANYKEQYTTTKNRLKELKK